MTKTKSVLELDSETRNKIIKLYNNKFAKKKCKNLKEAKIFFQEKKLFIETLFDKKLTDREFLDTKELSGNYNLTRRKIIIYGSLWLK